MDELVDLAAWILIFWIVASFDTRLAKFLGSLASLVYSPNNVVEVAFAFLIMRKVLLLQVLDKTVAIHC